ncbi:hypothetical protein TZ95_01569 [Streptococcus oralis subsp. tigurinus]|nr:hypothetical protein TZ95_01569 [Streptococcus oralis subsp. tigurinus]
MFLELTSSLLFKGTGLKTSTGCSCFFLFLEAGVKTSPGCSNSSQFLGVGLNTSTGCSCFFLFLEAGVKTSPGCSNSLQFLGVGVKTSPGRFYSSIKLLKTSSIMFHSSSESSGIGCNSPSVPSSFSMNE